MLRMTHYTCHSERSEESEVFLSILQQPLHFKGKREVPVLKTINSLSYKTQKKVIIVTFMFIPLLLLLVFSYNPAIKLIQLSLTDWDGFSQEFNYVGLKNFINIFKDTRQLMPIVNNLAYLLVMFLYNAMALYFAIILDSNIRFRNFFKSVIFLPYIINGVAVALIFNYLYDFNNGPINIILRAVGLNGVQWLGDSYFINFALCFIGVWKYTGYIMVGFLGSLQSIPPSYYEAAQIDGANFFQKTRYITIPGIKRTIELYLILGINGALQVFEQIWIITKGGPGHRSETAVVSIWKNAFEYQDFGTASALAILLVMVVIILITIQRKILGEEAD
jgi:multiple sugar transport system permease protein